MAIALTFAPRFNVRITATLTRQKITFAEIRAGGVRGLLIYCADYHCSHWTAIRWRRSHLVWGAAIENYRGNGSMIRITFRGFAIATALLSSGASAQHKLVYGAGMINCGEWQQYRSTGNKPGSYQAQAWIDGYLSGSNASGNGADFLAPAPSSIAYYAWIDNYCTQHPLDTLMLAAFKLKRELASRAPAG